jgi:hypothetical protein
MLSCQKEIEIINKVCLLVKLNKTGKVHIT